MIIVSGKNAFNNLVLTSYKKRFFYAVVGATRSTHDARMAKKQFFQISSIFPALAGNTLDEINNKQKHFSEIFLVD